MTVAEFPLTRREQAYLRARATEELCRRELPDAYDEFGPLLVGIALAHDFDRNGCSAEWLAERVRERYGD